MKHPANRSLISIALSMRLACRSVPIARLQAPCRRVPTAIATLSPVPPGLAGGYFRHRSAVHGDRHDIFWQCTGWEDWLPLMPQHNSQIFPLASTGLRPLRLLDVRHRS